MKASPYAKKLAREAGVDVSQATATGPEGRIVAADVQKLVQSGGGKAAVQPSSQQQPEEYAPSQVSHNWDLSVPSARLLYSQPGSSHTCVLFHSLPLFGWERS